MGRKQGISGQVFDPSRVYPWPGDLGSGMDVGMEALEGCLAK